MDGKLAVNSFQLLVGIYLALALWVWIFVSYCLQLVNRVAADDLPKEFPPNHSRLFGLILGIVTTVIIYQSISLATLGEPPLTDPVSLIGYGALVALGFSFMFALLLGMIASWLQD